MSKPRNPDTLTDTLTPPPDAEAVLLARAYLLIISWPAPLIAAEASPTTPTGDAGRAESGRAETSQTAEGGHE